MHCIVMAVEVYNTPPLESTLTCIVLWGLLRFNRRCCFFLHCYWGNLSKTKVNSKCYSSHLRTDKTFLNYRYFVLKISLHLFVFYLVFTHTHTKKGGGIYFTMSNLELRYFDYSWLLHANGIKICKNGKKMKRKILVNQDYWTRDLKHSSQTS
jgi:hypothetical protein